MIFSLCSEFSTVQFLSMPNRRSTRSTRKAKDVDKDWKKLDEGSPLPEEIEIEPVPITKKKETKKERKMAKKQ